jgi:hypothetical protein
MRLGGTEVPPARLLTSPRMREIEAEPTPVTDAAE